MQRLFNVVSYSKCYKKEWELSK